MGTKRLTLMGSPCATAWGDDWIGFVDEVEKELGHRVCGGVTVDGVPCRLEPGPVNGRCRFHGGGKGTGARKGNYNARSHGLYSRRLQVCGRHCALWEACSYAGEDVLGLAVRDRPNCFFEQAEYEALMGEGFCGENENGVCFEGPDLGANTSPDSLRHSRALLQVFMGRAAAALSVAPMVETVSAEGDKYSMRTTKMSSALQAFLRLARENHRYLMGTPQKARRVMQQRQVALEHDEQHEHAQGIADIMQPLFEKTKGVIEQALEEQAPDDEAARPPGG